MKTFKELMAEVAQPISQGEKNFVAAHKVDHKNLVPGVTDQDHVFKGTPQRLDPTTSSYHNGDDVKAYDAGLKVEEEVEDLDIEVIEESVTYHSSPKMEEKRVVFTGSAAHTSKKAAQYKKQGYEVEKMKKHTSGIFGDKSEKHTYTMVHKEEVSQIDEISKKTLGSYVTKAASDVGTHTGAAAAYGSSSKSPDPKKMAQHQAIAAKRNAGLQKAVGKLTKEEVEQVDEMHSALVPQDHADAKKMTPAEIKAKHQKYLDTEAHHRKRMKDMSLTSNQRMASSTVATAAKMAATEWKNKYMKEEVELDEKTLTSGEMKKREEVVKAIKRENPKMDKSMAYAIATKTAKRVAEEAEELDEKLTDTAKTAIRDAMGPKTKNNPMMKSSKSAREFIKLAKSNPKNVKEEYISEDDDMDYEGEMARAELNAICDKAGILADMLENDTQLEAWLQSKITKAKYMIDSVYDYMMYSEPNIKSQPTDDYASDRPYSTQGIMANNYETFLNRMGEEVEQIDERVMASDYKVSSEPYKDQGHRPLVTHKEKGTTMYLGQTVYKSSEHAKEHAKAYLHGYAQGGDMHANRKGDEYRKANKSHVVSEELELDEARRGRPRKDGTSSGEEEGGREHIIVQLRKANNLRGERHTEFNDNSKHKLSLSHVNKALDMHRDMKPQQKAEFESRLAKSHASFHDAVSGKPAEKPKSKITLGGMKKEEVDPTSRRSDRGDLKAAVITGKAGKLEVIKRQAARKELKVDADMQKEAADMNTANVKKLVKHDCAKHVEHAEWGKGTCIPEQHTIVETEEGHGFVTHYDVMFEHGIEQNVPVQKLNVLISESHEHGRRRMSEALKGSQHKIDANKNGKVDAHDFHLLRKKTKVVAKPQYDKMRPAFKEEAEQIDELSKGTLKSYVKKALDTGSEKSVSNLASRGGYELGQSADDDASAGLKHDRKSVVRSQGVQRAVNKLTKEEAGIDESTKANMQQDSVDKIKKDPLASKEALKLPPTQGNDPVGGEGEIASGAGKFSVAEELLNKLYDTLSEENKKIFEQKYSTEEGKLELLAFAEEQGL